MNRENVPGGTGKSCPTGERRYGLLMLNALSDVYERGWQPLDVIHVTEREADRRDVPHAIVAVLFHALAGRASERAPEDWARQLDVLADREPGGGASSGVGSATATATAERLFAEDPAGGALEAHLSMNGVDTHDLAKIWRLMPPMSPLCDPPSAWPQTRRRQARVTTADSASANGAGPDPRILGRIRGLLAKAESTDFPEEAESLTAKAQELITRYAIDSALLHRFDTGFDYGVTGKRVHLANPYLKEKVQLLTEIGQVNSVRTVWADKLAIATIVGTPADVEQVELLYTSLLIQATRAMQATESRHTSQRTAAFRRAFLLGYAVRIGQRMREARETATAETAADAGVSMGELVPVLAARTAAVDQEFSRLFPHTKASRSRPVDAAGFHAGSAAADKARLGVGGPGIER